MSKRRRVYPILLLKVVLAGLLLYAGAWAIVAVWHSDLVRGQDLFHVDHPGLDVPKPNIGITPSLKCRLLVLDVSGQSPMAQVEFINNGSERLLFNAWGAWSPPSFTTYLDKNGSKWGFPMLESMPGLPPNFSFTYQYEILPGEKLSVTVRLPPGRERLEPLGIPMFAQDEPTELRYSYLGDMNVLFPDSATPTKERRVWVEAEGTVGVKWR